MATKETLAESLGRRYATAAVGLTALARSRLGTFEEQVTRQRIVMTVGEQRVLSVVFTYDVGHHGSGWWRNSQYDRCWHLSLVAINLMRAKIAPEGAFETPTSEEQAALAHLFFHTHTDKLWCEPPAGYFDAYRTTPQARHTYHLRLFTDREFQPIQPEGEVYTLKPWDDGTSPQTVFRS